MKMARSHEDQDQTCLNYIFMGQMALETVWENWVLERRTVMNEAEYWDIPRRFLR